MILPYLESLGPEARCLDVGWLGFSLIMAKEVKDAVEN